MIDDVRYGIRRMLQGRGWTVVVVLSLALGIGANTALFSLVEAVLLRDLPVQNADHLVYLNWVSAPNPMYVYLNGNSHTDDATGLKQSASFSTLTFERIRRQSRTLSSTFAFAPLDEANVRSAGNAEIVNGQFVSGNYFEVLGVSGVRGRPIVGDDDRSNATPAIVISDALWHRHFARNPTAIGQTLTVNAQLFTIVGVAPAEFTGTSGFSYTADFSIPLSFESQMFPDDEHNQPYAWWLHIMGRRAPGVSRDQVQAELERVFQAAARDGWNAAPARLTSGSSPRAVPRLQVLDGSGGLADQVRYVSQLMISLAAIVVTLLLIVCVNVANMMLARATARQREIAVRRAIGAGRLRLIRLFLAESLVLCAVAALFGLLLAAWGVDALAFLISETNGTVIDLQLNGRVLVFAVIVSIMTGVAFGLAPALHGTRPDLGPSVRHYAANLLGNRSRLTRPLLAGQLALSILLLVPAGLLMRSVQQLQRVDIGFNPQQLLLFDMSPEDVGYDEDRTVALYEDVIQRLESLPGVEAATTSDYPLVSSSGSGTVIHVQHSDIRPDDGRVRRLKIRANFMKAMGLTILHGRDFSPQDVRGGPAVALINETLARRFFPNANPVGQRFGFGSAERSGDIEIVGVVNDARIDEARSDQPPTVYLPYLQRVHGEATFEVRTAGPPLLLVPAIRALVRQAATDVPVVRFRTQEQQVQAGFSTERMLARASTLFSAVALMLACIGLYGMLSYSVARRTNEIALRLALGARRDSVVWLVLREVVALLLVGVVLGLAGASVLSRSITHLLYGLTPNDPFTIAASVLSLATVGLLAGYLPARRAANVDPWAALRYE